MSTCRPSGISARTKSLRERFGSKRSYSESFKDPPAAAVAAVTTATACSSPSELQNVSSSSNSLFSTSLSEDPRRSGTSGNIQLPSCFPDQHFYSTVLSEETYCSALDINSQQGDPRFPWQRDVAIQCDMSPADDATTQSSTSSAHSSIKSSSFYSGVSPSFTSHQSDSSRYRSSDRPWQSPLTSRRTNDGSSSVTDAAKKGPLQRHPSILQRALSFDRGPSKGPPSSQSSLDDFRSSSKSHLYVPHHIQTLTPSPESIASNEVTSPTRDGSNSAPQSRSSSPLNETPPETPPCLKTSASSSSQPQFSCRKPSASERRKLCFVRKETNSAPDSFEDNLVTTPERTPEKSGAGYFTFDTMQRLLDLSMKASASQNKIAEEKSSFLLNIPSAGLVPGHEGKPGYLSLPSPNLQGEGHESNPVFKKLSSMEDEDSEQEEPAEGPPASALHRRRALVPPKLLPDGYESASEDTEHSPNSQSQVTPPSESATPKTRRRSSIVVIPPMQICPGDLLVYSKVLTRRNDLLGRRDFDGSTQCLAVTEAESSRKGKNTWSLLRLFDRSGRGKSDSLCGLEEVLSSLQPSEFVDEHLSKYKGMQWSEFVAHVEETRGSRRASGHSTSSSQWTPLLSQHTLHRTESVDSSLKSADLPSASSSEPVTEASSRNSVHDDTTSQTSSHSSQDYRPNRPSFLLRQSSSLSLSQDGSLGDQDQLPSHPPTPSKAIQLLLTRTEQRRREALWDLFQSECMFLYDHLMVLKNVFMEPLKKIQVEGFAMFAEPEVLFGNLDELCCVTYAFCKEFLHVILQNMSFGELNTTDVLVRLFKKSSKATSLTQAYHRYTLNYINALNYLETLRRQVEFNEFEKWCSRDSRCKKLQLTDLLVSPVQHIMRVPLLLREIEMRTDSQHEKETIANILEAEENSLRELDDKMKWLKNFERLLEIQRNIVWPSVLELDPKIFIPEFLKGPLSKQPCERLIVSPRRQIILEGPLQLLDSGKPTEMYIILFDDMLLITRRKKGLHKKKSSLTENWASSCSRGSNIHEGGFKYVVYKQPLSLDRFFIHDVTVQDGATNNLKFAFVLVCLNRFQQIVTVHTFQAPSETVKMTWLTKLRDTVDRWKRTLQNTVFRNQRLTSNNSSTTK